MIYYDIILTTEKNLDLLNDFGKAYDLYIKEHNLSTYYSDVDKKVFVDLMKISYAMGKLNI